MSAVLLLVALILFVIAAIITPTTVPQRLVAIGLAFMAAGMGALQVLGVG